MAAEPMEEQDVGPVLGPEEAEAPEPAAAADADAAAEASPDCGHPQCGSARGCVAVAAPLVVELPVVLEHDALDTCDGIGIRGNGETAGAISNRCSRSLSGWSATDALSVRTDWSSTDGSPHRSAVLDGHLLLPSEEQEDESRLSEPLARCLRSGRRTLSATLPCKQGKSPVRFGVHSIQNLRSEMEDAHRAVLGVEPSSSSEDAGEALLGSLSYFAIFDGHGGARAAEFSGERLCALLAADRERLLEDPEGALRHAFHRTEEEWLTLARAEELMDGTTAAVAIVDRMARRCVVGNVGDSEVLLGTRTASGETAHQTLTEVHHLKRSASEAARVEAAGGRVWRGRLGHPRISPQVLSLSVSRAIGDLFFKDDRYTDGQPSGLIADPYIRCVEVCTSDISEQFLVIGCDGLWDTVTYSEAADLVFAKLGEGEDPQAISEALVRLARDAGSSDNITVMVVVL